MSEKMYTDQEVHRMLVAGSREVLKGLLRNLTEVREQRGKVPEGSVLAYELQRRGEIEGLNIAIAAVKRRMGR